MLAIIGKAHVMGLTTAANGDRVNHLAEGLAARLDVDRNQLVRTVTHSLYAKRPDMQIVLLTLDQPAHVGRVAGLVTIGRSQSAGNRTQRDDGY